MNLKNSVCVMMSTYNGEKYLSQQIESILSQEKIKLNLLIRDDGSVDSTLKIIEKYSSDNRVKYYIGKNLGPALSFIDLLFKTNYYDYYAFADQDDYWMPNKLYEGILMLEQYKDIPALYNSLAEVVDENLTSKNIYYGTRKTYDFLTQLARSNVIGCTMIFNKTLFDMVRLYRPNYVCMHDQWITIVCKAVGGIEIKDERSFIKYRQHDNNVFGAERSFIRRLKKSTLFGAGSARYNQAYELMKGYKDHIPPKYQKQLIDIMQYRTSMRARIRCILYKYNAEQITYNMLIRLSFLRRNF